MTRRPWDEFELSDGPARRMTLREVIDMYGGDIDRAIFHYDFENIGSDIFEENDPRLFYTGPHIVAHEDSPTIVGEVFDVDVLLRRFLVVV